MTNVNRPATQTRPALSRRKFLSSTAAATTSSIALSLVSQLSNVQHVAAQNAIPFQPTNEEQFEQMADEYSLAEGVNYLNHASIGMMPKTVRASLNEFLEICETNPWLYIWGDAWDEPLQTVRSLSAQLMGCEPNEMAITHNTTEMFNTFAAGVPLTATDEVLFSTLCHSGASIPFTERAKWGQYRARRFEFPLQNVSELTPDRVVEIYERQVTTNTKALILPHLDNTIGLRYPIEAISKMARAKGIRFIAVDAAQTPGMIPMNCSQMGVDMVASSGHKWLGGPKGTGLAYVSSEIQDSLHPMWVTWGQRQWHDTARKFEDYGTRNMAEVLGLGEGVRFIQRVSEEERENRLRDLWSFTKSEVDRSDTLTWNSPRDWKLAGSLFSIGVESPAKQLASELFAEHGIVTRPFTNMALNHLRISPNIFTSKSQIQRCLELIA